eukprot:1153820-Pelagomonas_calceolata.AAC.2
MQSSFKLFQLSYYDKAPRQINFLKVLAHSCVIGNEGSNAWAQTAVLMDTTDISLPDAKDPFHNFFWLSAKFPENTPILLPLCLTNLKDELKTHMHNKHKLGSADSTS